MKKFQALSLAEKGLIALVALIAIVVLAHFGVVSAHAFDIGGMILGGVGLEVVSGQTTAPGATVTALTSVTGDSFTLRNANPAKRIQLLGAWSRSTTAGIMEIRSPKLHDNVRAMRFRVTAADALPAFPFMPVQKLYPQDVLTVSQSGGGGAEIDQTSLLIWYEDLPGADGRFIDVNTLMKRVVNVFAVETALAPGATGNYSGAAAINASFDTFIANTDYALMGYQVSTLCTTVRWRGADTANMGVAGPGSVTIRNETNRWFMDLSNYFNLPLIPVFNSANKGGILVDALQDNGGSATNVTSIFAQLG